MGSIHGGSLEFSELQKVQTVDAVALYDVQPEVYPLKKTGGRAMSGYSFVDLGDGLDDLVSVNSSESELLLMLAEGPGVLRAGELSDVVELKSLSSGRFYRKL